MGFRLFFVLFFMVIYNYKSTRINIYDCEYSHSYSEVLRYFNEYTINQDRINRRHYETSILFSIINAKKPFISLFIQNAISFSIKGLRTVDINNIKELKTITDHTDVIYSLLLLNDNRIASCSNDKTIRIFNPSNNYICEKVIKNNKVNYINKGGSEIGNVWLDAGGHFSIVDGEPIAEIVYNNEPFYLTTDGDVYQSLDNQYPICDLDELPDLF